MDKVDRSALTRETASTGSPAPVSPQFPLSTRDRLCVIPGVEGVGLRGERVLVVYVSARSAARNVPSSLDDYDIVTEFTGPIKAL